MSVDELQRFLNTDPKINELEVRLGSFDMNNNKRFISNIPLQLFNKIKRVFLENSEKQYISIEYIETKVYNSANYLKIYDVKDNEIVFRRKTPKGKIDNYKYGYRISNSLEENIKNVPKDIIFDDSQYRHKNRISFKVTDKQSPLRGFSVDMTIVKNYKNNTFQYSSYEIELERNEKIDSVQKFNDAINELYKYYRGSTYIDFKDDIYNIDMNEYFNTISSYNSLINTFFQKHLKRKEDIIRYQNKPINLKIKNLLENNKDFAITSKLDGTRTFLYVTNKGSYLIQPPNDVVKIDASDNNKIYILDGELINGTIYLFDIVYTSDVKNIMNKEFHFRYEYLEKIKLKFKNLDVQIKNFYHDTSDFYKNVNEALEENKYFEESGIKTDGIIIQPIKKPYINDITYKWKPHEQLTIDFKVCKIQGTEDEYNLLSMENESFRGTKNFIYEKTVTFKDNLFKKENVEDRIIEFEWNHHTKNFKPVRFRIDRDIPNKNEVVNSVWEDINKPVTLEMIKGKDIQIMYEYHNLIRNLLAKRFIASKGKTLIDDQNNEQLWNELKVQKTYYVDSTVKIKDPYVENINSSLRDIDLEFPVNNMILCGNTLKSMYKSETIFNETIDAISSNLDKDGFLIAIIPDSNKIMKLPKLNEYPLYKGKWEGDSIYGKGFKIANKQDPVQYLFNFKHFIEKMREKNIKLYINHEQIKKEYEQLIFDIYNEELDNNKLKNNMKKETMMEKLKKFNLEVDEEDIKESNKNIKIDDIKIKLKNIGIKIKKEYDINDLPTEFIDFKDKFGTEYELFSKYENKFIKNYIDFLPEELQKLSSVYRVIVLHKSRSTDIKSPLDLLYSSSKDVKLRFGAMTQHYSINDDSSLIHAILKCFSKNYNNLKTIEDKVSFVKEVRKKLGNVTKTEFKNIGNKMMGEEIIDRYVKLTRDRTKAEKLALSAFQLLLVNENELLLDNLELLEYISNRLQLNIYLISNISRDIYLPPSEKFISLQNKYKLLYDQNRPSIILLSIDGIYFNPLSKKGTYLFSPTDPLIKKINDKYEKMLKVQNIPTLYDYWDIIFDNKGNKYVVIENNDVDYLGVIPLNKCLRPDIIQLSFKDIKQQENKIQFLHKKAESPKKIYKKAKSYKKVESPKKILDIKDQELKDKQKNMYMLNIQQMLKEIERKRE